MNSKKTMMLVLVALTLAAFVAVGADQNKPPEQSPKPVGLLDGKIFDGTVKAVGVPDDKIGKPLTESLTFKEGLVYSVAFKPQGFAEAAYVSKRDGSKVIFTASFVKADEPLAHLEWSGTVKGTKSTNLSILTATAKLTREGKVLGEYNISAKLRIVDAPNQQ